ncbi:MAG: AzlC family ABC transporter permease [Pseudomonadota bacterium]
MTDPDIVSDGGLDAPGDISKRYWIWQGVKGLLSGPAFILIVSFIGFGAYARDAGLTAFEAAFLTGTVWALPSQMVFIGSMAAGLSVTAAAIAVAFASVRFMPMTAALMPVLRGENTPRWVLLVLSHFVAITAWIISMQRLPSFSREARIPYFIGFACGLTFINIFVTIGGFYLAATVPVWVGAALFALAPIYFVFALWSAARTRVDALALVLGLVVGPIIISLDWEFDIVWAGLIGGTAAFAIGQVWKARERA